MPGLLEGVGYVYHGYVEPLGRLLQKDESVLDAQLQSRVVEGAAVKIGQVAPAQLHDLAVDVGHHGALHYPMGKDLANRGALTAAGHEHICRCGWATKQGWTSASIADELVHLCGLGFVVQDQGPAEARGVVY